ncbi:M3 family metallopeptidase [Stygiobacter electus]|uniref:M3 family metallopeptidase n=1 Tax=Stygiobacter electus TaxID=3032292 RepID=A0AAE3NX85_9BACT|nr:M3 family metallopeptidase [Stygiobacter electus]MDF1611736.1 M3 family metallopeptidase [Stygiobacter electus]
MKVKYFLIVIILLLTISKAQEKNMNNPFFKVWNTPFNTPPFSQIKIEDFLPAFEEGMKQHKDEIQKIIDSKETPTFQNTIVELEKSGELLTKVANVFYNLNNTITNDEMQKINQVIAPKLAKHNDDIKLNEKLFEKIKSIYLQREKLNLTSEEKLLLENYYSDFVRGGVNLTGEQKERFRKINEELSVLTVKFGEYILKETNSIGLVIENKDDLIGLPETVIQGAFETAKSKGLDGKWAFTLQRASWTPFLQYSPKRELREKLFKAYINRGNNNNEFDTKNILRKIASLRVERANLLGFKTHADFKLEKNMAKNPETVFKFLNDLWIPAIKKAKSEADEMQKLIYKEGNNFKLQPWDWWYYAEKVKKEKYDLDESMLRPYFKLENVISGVFDVANKLYGLQFVERNDIETYHPDVKVFEVKESNGKHVGILYTDYFPRDSKESGAWCSSFRDQSNINNKFITPLVTNCGNFSKPTTDKPALLSLDEVNTLFHEFGHALHSLLNVTVYPNGKRVPIDFVELPSQIMENWATHPQVLKMYAKHYQTNEPMPDELIQKIENAKLFNQGFETVEYLAASFLDMYWHTLTDTTEQDVISFEKNVLNKIGLIPEIESRYQSTNFLHIFSGDGYSSGYYGYIWAAVLDADAFAAFEETSLFDKETAKKFRTLLEKSGTIEPMELYKQFRGREPKVDALLKNRGLN